MAAFQNNGKLKLLIIVGTRPEIIRLAEVIRKCRRYFDTLLAHTGQNYDYTLNGVFFRDLELDAPDAPHPANRLRLMAAGRKAEIHFFIRIKLLFLACCRFIIV